MRKTLICLTAIILLSTSSFAQSTIKGKVLDRNGQPVEGASVKVKGSSNGTATDKDGNYSISTSSSDATLVITGVGLAEQEVSTSGSGFITTTVSSSSVSLNAVQVVGSRSLRRSATETPAPIDIIPLSRVTSTIGQVDLNQILQYLAPSFNSNRQTGADGADHVDPASLRGLGPDQTLVLINGKRRHQSALVNLFGTRGRGNTGTDLNTIPAAAIERIEILRDGAAAQYGSDAIAGVINIVLKTNVNTGTASVTGGTYITGYGSSLKSSSGSGEKIMNSQTDGLTLNANVNYGFALKNNGYFNVTGDFLKKNKTYRPSYKTDAETEAEEDPRRKAGDASLNNYTLFFNAAFPLKGATSFYAFGGYSQRNGSAYAYTRHAGDDRNVPAIYPNGFDPLNESDITDRSVSFGIKSKFNGWDADFNATLGGNRFEYEVSNTLNASLGAASPTHFKAGGFQLTENMLNINLSKAYSKVAEGATLSMGAEVRQDQYKIFKGEVASYKQYPTANDAVGGAQGFPGFQPTDETNKQRVNYGAYVDGELDVTKGFLISAALRGEHYSDFGWTGNFKIATRVKVDNNSAIRGSVSTGFRAPSLPQINFSNTFTNVAAGVISEVVVAPNSGDLAKAVGIPTLKQERSVNVNLGITTRPIRDLSITIDGYQVSIKDRVILTGYFGQDDNVIGPILQQRNIASAQFFTNSINTKTTGLDVVATYGLNLGKGRLNTTLGANFNKLEITKVNTVAALAGKEDVYLSAREQYFLQASAPKHKINLILDYKINNFTTNLRFTKFAAIDLINYSDELEHNGGKLTTDLTFAYLINNKITVSLGGANILDVYPDNQLVPGNTETGTRWEAIQMGIGGAYYFAKVGLKF